MRSTGAACSLLAAFSPDPGRVHKISILKPSFLQIRLFSFRFKTVNIYFASHSPLTALAVFILPWEFPLWSSEPNQIPVYHTGSKRLGESQPCNLHYLFAYVRDWQPELGQCFTHKRRRCSREEGAPRRIGVQLPTCRPHNAAGRHHPCAAPRFLQHRTAWRVMSSIKPGRACCMQKY